MKRIVLISVICSLQLYGMNDTLVQKDSEKLAECIATSILHTSDKSSTEQAIIRIKEFLKDDRLSSRQSLLVKDDLIKILSKKVFESFYSSIPEEKEPTQTIVRTVFFDGTVSLEKQINFYPLDRSEYETISHQARSPWYDLSFEDFVRSYCYARSSYSDKQKHPLASTIENQQ